MMRTSCFALTRTQVTPKFSKVLAKYDCLPWEAGTEVWVFSDSYPNEIANKLEQECKAMAFLFDIFTELHNDTAP